MQLEIYSEIYCVLVFDEYHEYLYFNCQENISTSISPTKSKQTDSHMGNDIMNYMLIPIQNHPAMKSNILYS